MFVLKWIETEFKASSRVRFDSWRRGGEGGFIRPGTAFYHGFCGRSWLISVMAYLHFSDFIRALSFSHFSQGPGLSGGPQEDNSFDFVQIRFIWNFLESHATDYDVMPCQPAG